MDKRAVLAIVLSLALVLLYQFLFVEPPKPVDRTAEVRQEEPGDVDEVDRSSADLLRGREGDSAGVKRALGEPDRGQVKTREILVESPLYTALLSTKGGGVTSFKLNKYRMTLDEDSEPIELVDIHEGMRLPLTVTFPDSSIDIPAEAVFEADREGLRLADERGEERIVFTWSYPGEVKVEKIYTFRGDSYTIDLEVRVHNLAKSTIIQNVGISWSQYMDPEARKDRFSHIGPVAFVQGELITKDAKKLEQETHLGPQVLWAGFQSKYFIASIISQQPSLTSMTITKIPYNNEVSVMLRGPRLMIPPGQSGIFNYTCYLGPKEYDTLKKGGVFLEASIDFGRWIKWLALPLLKVLKFINNYVNNYGLAIIILTIFIKILFWPLGTISYKSMKQMQKLQPEMARIREKYKNDKVKLQEETMALYRAHKVNPLGGCLPILIQIPVFFGLYRALLYSIELRHSPFVFWIQDLSAKDPYYITPIVMGATMFLQQKMMPAPGANEMQAKLMTWMPIIFTFLFLNFPSGLVIYWLFNNIISVGQQYWISKHT